MLPIKITLPKGFLEEEVRNDYFISKEMKEVWAVELDLLAEFDRVCRKYNLTYFADGGTLLGAIRHKGFIPWDDDIDVIMMRDQYEKFIKIAPNEFKHPYFLQTSMTDIGSFNGHAKLRNSETTAILSPVYYFEKMKINQGIFIDIFIADNLIDDFEKFEKQRKRAQFYKLMADQINSCTLRGYKNSKKAVVRNFRKTLSLIASPLLEKIALFFYFKHDKECQKYNGIETPRYALLTYQFTDRWQGFINDYSDVIIKDFEFISIPVCKGYEHTLTLQYGDWKQYVIGSAQHTLDVLDTKKSYLNYLK